MVDLHVHSVFSDGTLTPAELIALAQENGVTAVALCDHNTVAGLPSFLAAAEGSGECARRFRAAVTARRISLSSIRLISSTIFRMKRRADSLDFLGI